MIIYIDDNKHNENDIDNLFNNYQINYIKYDNVYSAVCKEEIEQAIDCSDLLKEDESFYDITGDKAEDIIWELTKELYISRDADSSFQELAEAAQLIVNRKIYSLKEINNFLEEDDE